MKLNKKLCGFLCTFQIALFCCHNISFGAAYKDISPSHWAYLAIENLHAKGCLNDFPSEKFNPDSYIDKFTSSKILAAVAGYTDGDYSAQKNIISKFSSKFLKWNKESNNQIAFLLSKNILTENDLESFMLFSSDGSEKFRAISREETAVFLVRLMGKTSEAQKLSSSNFFKDSQSITETRRGSINYLKSVNVLSGDKNGFCNPKKAVTRAEFCVLVNNAAKLIPSSPKTNPSENINNVATINGTINNYYKNLNLIQIKSGDKIDSYRLSGSVKITLNNKTVSADSISEGLKTTALINNSEIIKLSLSSPESKPDASKQPSSTISSIQPDICMDPAASGTIQSIQINPSLRNECVIELLSDSGKRKLFSGTRYTIPIYSLKIGDFAHITADKGQILTIKIDKKDKKSVSSGYVSDIDNNKITIETAGGGKSVFYHNENFTECYDCTIGEKIDFTDIKKFTEVYIFCEDINSRAIDVIFIVDSL